MLKRHTVTLHHMNTDYNDKFDHMDGVMGALARQKTKWMVDCFVAVKLARETLSNHYAALTLSMRMIPIAT